MGIFGFLKKQFVDVIDWTEEGPGVLALQYPMEDREIQNGAELTVRETQAALFVNEGKVADLFGPGQHRLSTKTLPLLTALKNWDKLFASPFKSDVYFFSLREQLDQRWGTTQPIVVRDKEFGPIRLRAHGAFSYRISDPRVFFGKVSGTQGVYGTEQLSGQLLATVLTELAAFLGRGEVAFLDMAANQQKFSETLREALKGAFARYGLTVETFMVQSLSLPEDLQERLDKVASMRMVGDLKQYAQFQAADSISAAARNEGGAAGAGVGMGAGIAMGRAIMDSMASGPGGAAGGGASTDPMQVIAKLHELVKAGALTQAEFDAKKAELLKAIK